MKTDRPRPIGRALCAATACLALAATAGAGAQTVSLNAGGKQVRIAVGEDAVLPADFPKDVALPADAKLSRVQHAGASTTLEFTAPGEPAAAVADLDARMRADGWEQASVRVPDGIRAQAWEKDRRAVIAWAVPDDANPHGVRVQVKLVARLAAAPAP